MIKKPVINSILNVLHECNGNPIGEAALFNFTNMKLDAMAATSDEIKANLQHCKTKGWIDYIVDDYGETKWFITDAGKVVRS